MRKGLKLRLAAPAAVFFMIVFTILILPTGALSSRALAATNSLSLNEDVNNGFITVETGTIKAVWHYKALPSESYNQSGGNLYELYYKPMDPNATRNLVAYANYGNQSSTTLWAGIGGVGGTDMYATDMPPGPSGTNSFTDVISDNNASGTLISHSAIIDSQGNAVLTFVYNIHNQSTGKDWYSVTKTWTVEPSGAIHESVNWKLLASGYFSEIALRSGWSYYAGWDRFSKYGRNWLAPNSDTYVLGHDNIENETAQSWDNLNRFQPDWAALTGSTVAPTVKMSADNSGLGFRGSGSYQLGAKVWGTGAESMEEQCSELGGVTGAQDINWMAWWSGNPPNGSRYKWLTAGTTWSDSYRIDLFPGSPGGGPDISAIAATFSGGDTQIAWTTDTDSDSEVDILNPYGPWDPNSPSGDWNSVGSAAALTTQHSVQVTGLQPGSTYTFQVKSRDAGGNFSVSSDDQLTVPSVAAAPNLVLNQQAAYWKSYSDYLNGQLTAEFAMQNHGSGQVSLVNIDSVTASKGVIATNSLPLEIGDLAAGASRTFTIAYEIPSGVVQFVTYISAAGVDANGQPLNYPG